MLHAKQIAAWSASIQHPHVKLLGSFNSDNPNYLWLKLDISHKAQAGNLMIVLRKGPEKSQDR